MIVIPMVGLSSRFFKAGYTKPKYMLEAHGQTLFSHSIKSFSKYFDTKKFLFIIRDVYQTPEFVEEQINELGIKNYHVVILSKETRGQAETVALGLNEIKHKGSITIFNIDTFRPDFTFPDLEGMQDGYLEVFDGEGDHWSFAKPLNEDSTLVSLTSEKSRISNLCSTGLYYFRNIKIYNFTYDNYIKTPELEWEKGELYIAPLYNFLIKTGYAIHYHKIASENVIFCGVPEEYIEFKETSYVS